MDKITTALCFDVGLKRTGVASGQSITATAHPAGQLIVTGGRHNWQELDKLMTEWQPNLIVVGDPSSSDPALCKAINRLKSHIQKNHKLPIIDVDERLSTNAANIELADGGLSQARKTALRDQVAACLILESYFNSID